MQRLTTLILATMVALALAGPAWASCTTHTYFLEGRIIVCTQCCFGTACTTTCI
jgi:hypothetical protein